MPSLVQYRCPSCQSIDWFRDGCVIADEPGGFDLRCGRVQRPDPALRGTTWSCNSCAYEVVAGSTLAGHLDAVQHRTCDEA